MKSPEMIALWRKLGMNIELHDDHFHPEADDDLWIAGASSKEWVIISADKAMEREYIETVINTKARIILLVDNSSGAPHWAAAIVKCLEGVCDMMRNCERPTIVRVAKFGSISVTRTPAVLLTRLNKFQTQRITRTKRHAQKAS